MFKKLRKTKKGFTLLETIIAVVVLGIAVTTFSQAYFAAQKASMSNKQKLEALIEIQNQFERIRDAKNNKVIISAGSMNGFLTSDDEGYTYIEEANCFIKDEYINGAKYTMKIYIENNPPELFQVVMEVQPQDTNAVKLGTKFYISD